jgi:phosphate transport system protein
MRIQYTERLQGMRSQVLGMGHSANEMVRMATDSIINSDPSLASEVIRLDDSVDSAERETMQSAIVIVMQESPVASDLKFLVSTLGIVSEIEKVADHAVKLSRRGLKLGGMFPGSLKIVLSELSEQARNQFNSALKLYTEYSPELAESIIVSDDAIDAAYSKARNKIFEFIKEDPNSSAAFVRTIEIFHALEHVADHAVAIAKRIQLIHAPITPDESLIFRSVAE